MSKLPLRPTHTGSARAEALRHKARQERVPRPPIHAIGLRAAVALGELPVREAVLTRQARRPLSLDQGRQAWGLRQAEGGPLLVWLSHGAGARKWVPVEGLLSPERLRAWVRDGFG